MCISVYRVFFLYKLYVLHLIENFVYIVYKVSKSLILCSFKRKQKCKHIKNFCNFVYTCFCKQNDTISKYVYTFVYIIKKLRNIVAPELFCAICYSLFATAFVRYWFLRIVCLYLDIYSFAAFLAASQFSTELHPYCLRAFSITVK